MWFVMEELAILERARLGFVSVANQVNRLAGAFRQETPFHPAGKTRATAPTNLAVLDLGDNIVGLHAERFWQRTVAALANIVVHRPGVTGLRQVREQDAFFQRVRR